jgi:hypothetical protein
MMRGSVDYIVRLMATALTAMPFFCAAARAETTAGIGVSGNLEYSNNPFLLTASNTAAVRARVSLSPFIEERTARSSLRVSGDASFSAYNRSYRDAVDLSSQVGYSNRLSRQFSIRGGVSLNSSINSIYNSNPIFDAPSAANVVPRIIDITVIGFQQRTTNAQASAGLTYSIDDKNSISLGYDGSVARYPQGANRSEYSNIRQNVSYSRVISSRANLGASVSVSRVNYFGTPLGDARIISPSLDGTFRLAANWTLSGGIGFSSSRVNVGFGRLSSTDLSGSVNLCRTDTRTNFCFNGSRSTAASSFDGVRTSTTAGLSYSYRLNSRDSISASGGYSRSTVPQRSVGAPTDYASATTSFSRRFSDRMTGQITGGFSRSTFQGTRSTAYGSIGINYSFGNQ